MDYRKEIDFSSLSCYLDCPRKFLFQYIMHFRSNRKSIHLVFGSCWHYGLEVVYIKLLNDPRSLTVEEATALSIIAFNNLWSFEGKPYFPNEDIVFPKSPGNAANMYYKYWKQFLKIDQEGKRVLAVESPFTISLSHIDPILPNYIGRLDLVYENLENQNIEIIDHKTTKALYPTSLHSFEMSMQTDGYLTAGNLFYDRIPTMTYNIALCQKTKIGFHRYYVNKRHAALEQFLLELVYYTKQIIIDLKLLSNDLQSKTTRTDIIDSFRRKPGYPCTLYMTPCPYFDICKIRNNPLLWYNNPPQGYSINEWNPAEHEAEMKRKLKELI